MYHVTDWDTKEIHKSFDKIGAARKWCRGMGHNGEDHPFLTGYPPIAYVANDDGDLVYNPRFSKRIGSGVAGLINAQPPNHF